MIVSRIPLFDEMTESGIDRFRDELKSEKTCIGGEGGRSWSRHEMVHGPKTERLARYPDGCIERPQSQT